MNPPTQHPAPTPAPPRDLHLAPAAGGLTVLPVTGIPDIRPGDDLAALLWRAAGTDLRDGDVLVVTSKIISKAEGRLVPSPTDQAERDALRRKLIDQESVRLVAQAGRTRIVQNRLGLVAAAAGVDTSNVHDDEIALLPVDPDGSAAALVAAMAARGRRVGVVVTDTQGRAWRNGVTDVAIGAAGVVVLEDHRGGVDDFGNELVVTQVALADEIAAAADLVKGKLSGVPVAIMRGLDAPGLSGYGAGAPGQGGGGQAVDGHGGGGYDVVPGPAQTAAALIRPAGEDLFRLGTDLAIEWGRRDALAPVPPGHEVLHADARSALTAWQAPDPGQAALRSAFLTLLAARPDATSRSCVPGHLTASVIVLTADHRHTLLTLHPRVGRWLQLGGHCEAGDVTLAAAALREAREESGIGELALDPVPIGLDVHPITCSLGVATHHFDVRFVALAPAGARPIRSHESAELRLWPVDALPEGSDRDGLTAMVRAAVGRSRSGSRPPH